MQVILKHNTMSKVLDSMCTNWLQIVRLHSTEEFRFHIQTFGPDTVGQECLEEIQTNHKFMI